MKISQEFFNLVEVLFLMTNLIKKRFKWEFQLLKNIGNYFNWNAWFYGKSYLCSIEQIEGMVIKWFKQMNFNFEIWEQDKIQPKGGLNDDGKIKKSLFNQIIL
jgi:hypothetical protein